MMKNPAENDRQTSLSPRLCRARWLIALCATFLALDLVQAEDKKPDITPPSTISSQTINQQASGGLAAGIELSAQSARFIEIAAVGPETNQVWGRPIPGRVSLQTSARINLGALVEGRVEQPSDKKA